MPNIDIRLSGDGAIPEMKEAAEAGKVHRTDNFILSALPAGMKSGRTSVAICVELPDGQWVFAESSLRLFLAAADALRARYGSDD